ncbi:hypothetical protein DIPPA_13026 [Diplonema papillatum]|nr:hypothetical protein DIPPA_13026 [Diplonema papillatum]
MMYLRRLPARLQAVLWAPTVQRRCKRVNRTDDDVPFASVNKYDWTATDNDVSVHTVQTDADVTDDELKGIIKRVLPQANVQKIRPSSDPIPGTQENEVLAPGSDPLLKLADLTSDRLSKATTNEELLKEYPDLENLPGVAQVLGRHREATEAEARVFSDLLSPAVIPENKPNAEADQLTQLNFSPEVRKAQIAALTAQLTSSHMHHLPDQFEAVRAAKLVELSPWEFETEEPPLPNEYWEMSSAERRFLGLPYRGDDGKWRPPLATFTSRMASDINLTAFRDIMNKVREHAGSKSQLVKEEVELLREAENKIFDHLRARLQDMAPFLDERSKIWRRRRGIDS